MYEILMHMCAERKKERGGGRDKKRDRVRKRERGGGRQEGDREREKDIACRDNNQLIYCIIKF